MKKKLEKCSSCEEDTWHMNGKRLAHKGDKHHIKRTTSKCMSCGKKEIHNRSKGKRIINGNNKKETK